MTTTNNAPWVFKRCRVIQVVDGDTVDLEVDLGFMCATKVRSRLYGINTPERGQPGWAEATNRLKELLAQTQYCVTVYSYKPKDKYGRFIVDLINPNTTESLNLILVREGHAVPYME